jgi:hypothetical protein
MTLIMLPFPWTLIMLPWRCPRDWFQVVSASTRSGSDPGSSDRGRADYQEGHIHSQSLSTNYT